MSIVPRGFALDEDHGMIVDAVREFAEGELLGREQAWDESETSVTEIIDQLAGLGLFGITLGSEYGGTELPFVVYAAIIHELSYYSPSVAVTVSVHNMVAKALEATAPESYKRKFLTQITAPENFGAFCLSEAGAGSDAGGTTTSAQKVDGGYLINGEKMWITNGMKAGWFLTLVRLKSEPVDQSLCAFAIDGSYEGITRTKIKGKMGIRGSETAVISFDNCFVPDEFLMGSRGEGLRVFLSMLNEGRVGIASQATGIAEACLDEMVAYAGQREQFGQPIGQFQAIGDMLATSATELEAARLLTWRAAMNVDQGKQDRKQASMAKLSASETANRIAYRAVQVHGGTGYVNECRVERLFRDARVTTIYEGTSEVQRIVISRELE
ncbi:MAG: acyl-CoA dehydrogenase family protein [Planctomycetota bacterium]|jgi:alkylation response protein AidB-like acyl-CoA dehydrogenase